MRKHFKFDRWNIGVLGVLVLLAGALAAVALASGSNPSFSFSSDEPGASFTCQLDGGAAAACTSPKTYTGLAPGAHTETIIGSFTVPTPPPPPPPSGVLVGDQTLEGTADSNVSGQAQAWSYTVAQTGTVADIQAYVDAGDSAPTVYAGLYTDSAGRPGSLLTSGHVTAVKGAWNKITVPAVNVTAGAHVWLAIMGASSGAAGFRDNVAGAGGCATVGSQSGQSSLPATWATSWAMTTYCPASLYAEGSGSTTTTSTSSTTPTTTTTTTSTTSTTTTTGTTPGGTLPPWVSSAWEPGDVGAGAPFAHMTQDILWPIQTTNGPGLDTSVTSDPAGWVNAIHAGGSQALFGIGGISDQNWENACNSTNQAGFVTNIVNYMVSNGFDGVDLDMEDYLFTSQGPPSPVWTSCAQAIAKAVHAATTKAGKTPILAEDVITNWEGSWLTPYVSQLDQINLMTYGDTCSSATDCSGFASDAADTVRQLCPNGGSCPADVAKKMVFGVDMTEHPDTLPTCGYVAQWARANGYRGVIDFLLGGDRNISPSFPCQTAIDP